MAIEAPGQDAPARPAVPDRGAARPAWTRSRRSCARSRPRPRTCARSRRWGTVQTVTSLGRRRRSAPRSRSGAAIGVYSIEVTQLARAEQRFFTYGTPDPAATTINLKTTADPLDATQGDPADPGIDITIPAGADANAAAAAINAKTDSPAYASVVGGQLVLSGKKTGMPLFAHRQPAHRGHRQAARVQEAEYTIDGVAHDQVRVEHRHRPARRRADAQGPDHRPGHRRGRRPRPGPDRDQGEGQGLRRRLQLDDRPHHGQARRRRRSRAPTTQSDYSKGALRSDPGLQGLLSKLRVAMGETFEGDPAVAEPHRASTSSRHRRRRARRPGGRRHAPTASPASSSSTTPSSPRRSPTTRTPSSACSAASARSRARRQRSTGILDPVARLGDGDLAKREPEIDREVARIKDAQRGDGPPPGAQGGAPARAVHGHGDGAQLARRPASSWLSGQIGGLASWSLAQPSVQRPQPALRERR